MSKEVLAKLNAQWQVARAGVVAALKYVRK